MREQPEGRHPRRDDRCSPAAVPGLRRDTQAFLRERAALAREHEAGSGRLEIWLPPGVAVLSAHQRYGVHACQGARRLAAASWRGSAGGWQVTGGGTRLRWLRAARRQSKLALRSPASPGMAS